jgi:hypothetical protein
MSPPTRVITTFAGVLKSPLLKLASTELACTVQTPRSNDAGEGFGDAAAGEGFGDAAAGEGFGDAALGESFGGAEPEGLDEVGDAEVEAVGGGAAVANAVSNATMPNAA